MLRFICEVRLNSEINGVKVMQVGRFYYGVVPAGDYDLYKSHDGNGVVLCAVDANPRDYDTLIFQMSHGRFSDNFGKMAD